MRNDSRFFKVIAAVCIAAGVVFAVLMRVRSKGKEKNGFRDN